MSLRQIFLDVETTGLRVDEDHRIIEIACVEMIDRKLTGHHFHCYLNPEREIEAGAKAIHGITNTFLNDKPLFKDIVNDFLAFIANSDLIIHNAPFDLAFLNHEGMKTEKSWKEISHYCHIIDTLQMARKLHVGQRNSLDALCKRYGVDNSKREWHGAMLDANLLAHVYLAMTGGQGSFFDTLNDRKPIQDKNMNKILNKQFNQHQLVVLKADENELLQHKKYLDYLKIQGQSRWPDEE